MPALLPDVRLYHDVEEAERLLFSALILDEAEVPPWLQPQGYGSLVIIGTDLYCRTHDLFGCTFAHS